MATSDINEADILGDHILILNNGMVECLGSSNYIKNHFNINYYLEIEKGLSDQTNEILSNYISGSKIKINKDEQQNKINKSNIDKDIFELPISSINNFKELNRLNKIYYENKNYLNHNSLFLPTLEEKYLQMNDQKSDNNNNELDDDDSYIISNDDNINLVIHIKNHNELPKINIIKKKEKSELKKLIKHMFKLYKYRIINILKNKNFISYALFFPLSVIGIISSISIYSKLMVNFGHYSPFITDLYYDNNEINLPVTSNNQSSSLAWNINPERTTIPALTNSQFNKILNTTNHNYAYNLTSYNNIEMNEIGKRSDQREEMYFVSSISGNIINDHYKINIFYNESIVHALPITINLISNSVLSYNNITKRIKTSVRGFRYSDIDDNKEYIIFNINNISIFLSISVFCLISVFENMIIKERINKLIHHYELAGYSKMRFWTYIIICDSFLFLTFLNILTRFLVYKYKEVESESIHRVYDI